MNKRMIILTVMLVFPVLLTIKPVESRDKADNDGETEILQVVKPAPKRIRKEVSITYKEDRINDHVFVHRDDRDHATGKKTQVWFIDGAAVDRASFEQALYTAEFEQQQKERAYERYLLELRQARAERIAKFAAIRLLDLVITVIEGELKRLDDEALRRFYQFNIQSIASSEVLNELRDDLLPRARKMTRSVDSAALQEINECVENLEKYPQRLQAFFYDSIEYGIKHADDPKLLKNWLSVVASSENSGMV